MVKNAERAEFTLSQRKYAIVCFSGTTNTRRENNRKFKNVYMKTRDLRSLQEKLEQRQKHEV